MKNIPIILFLFCCFGVQAQKTTTEKKLNCDSAMTQLDMNDCAARAYGEADTKLNEVYKALLKAYKSDTAFIHNLRTAEALWIKLRDAELMMKFPDRPYGWYGSVQPMCESMYLTDLTRERITYLKQWLDGIEEGDACIGSVKLK
jgi:uncharacterized protein YecT (DUF1311 family)